MFDRPAVHLAALDHLQDVDESVERVLFVCLNRTLDVDDVIDAPRLLGSLERVLQGGPAVAVRDERFPESRQERLLDDLDDLRRIESLELLDPPLFVLR